MKKMISAILACLMVAALTACTTKPATDRTSDFYCDIVKNVGMEGMPITGTKDGELYRYEEEPYVMEEDVKAYFAFEGVIAHLAEVGNFEIDSMEKYQIANDAIKDKTDLTPEEQTKISNQAVLDFYTSKAGITLTDEEIKTIGDAAVAEEEKQMVQSQKDMMVMELESAGFVLDDLGNFAFSTSLMNVKAYCVAIFMPAEGKTEAVTAACDSFIAQKQQEFEQYLADQYDVAKAAQVKVMKTGEVVLVMCQDGAEVMTSIEESLKK